MADTPLHRALFVLGSNRDAAANVAEAVRSLSEFGRIVAVSSPYESPAHGLPGQPNYTNVAAVLETTLSPWAICEVAVPVIEESIGGPRPRNSAFCAIDVDLVLYDEAELVAGHRTIPHPDVLGRAYFAIPLAEIAPDYVVPGDGRALSQIAEQLGG